MKHKTFTRGIHPSYNKGYTADKATQKARLPERVIIPLSQHIGAPCAALVKRGEAVLEGQKIGDVESFIAAPVHASISGTTGTAKRKSGIQYEKTPKRCAKQVL